jgi:tRNA pseudouridine(55) synthase
MAAIKQTVEGFKGRQHFNYPVFSSRTVQGKPLFQWAKENRLGEIVIPKTDIFIEDIKVANMGTVPPPVFVEHLRKSIGLVSGDFRQTEILSAWDEAFLNKISTSDQFVTCGLKVRCSSGSYMRTLAEEIGKRLGLPALAYSIRRTKIGDISVSEAYIIQ